MWNIKKETASLQTSDGVRLDADIYRPERSGEFPILLMRQPYGRAIASTVTYAHPRWYASHGYIVIIQDVRGRGTSEGEFHLFAHEVQDGKETVDWASQLPGSTGEVGMYGFSYQGMTQLYAAIAKPAALKVICPAMIGYDLYADWAYEGGAFCLQTNLGWAIQLAAETARLRGEASAYQQLRQAAGNLPLHDSIPANPKVLQALAPDSFYHTWLANSDHSAYWQQLSPKAMMGEVDLPMLHIGGWFDTYLRGTLHLYRDMAARSARSQHLIVGPWVHLPWGRKVGAFDYGSQAASPVDQLQLRWFDQFLKGIDTGMLEESPVRLFEMGSNQWRYFETFPSPDYQFYYLSTSGLASTRDDAGILVETCPQDYQEDVFVHDPWRPVPALGGHASLPAGSFDRSHLDCRTDIITYTSTPLRQKLHLAGELIVEIYCTADQPSYDLCAVLSQVTPEGKVYNLTQGYRRVDDPNRPLRLTLQATCVQIPQGHCLRLSLSGANFPAYPVNPGTGAKASEASSYEAQVITIRVSCGSEFSSQVLLPIEERY